MPDKVSDLYHKSRTKSAFSKSSHRPLQDLSESYKETESNKDTDQDLETAHLNTTFTLAVRILQSYPNPNNEVYFEEQLKCEEALERLIGSGCLCTTQRIKLKQYCRKIQLIVGSHFQKYWTELVYNNKTGYLTT